MQIVKQVKSKRNYSYNSENALLNNSLSDSPNLFGDRKSNKNTPFRRVKDDEITVDPRVGDNSFEAKVRASFCYIKSSV